MKTKELIAFLIEKEFINYSEDYKVIDEIVKRLKELEELRGILKNPHLTQDYTMEELIKKLKE